MSEYPEHEKLKEISDTSQSIGEFVDWLNDRGVQLMKYETYTEPEDCVGCQATGRIRVVVPYVIDEDNPGMVGSGPRRTMQTCPDCDGTGKDPNETWTTSEWGPVRGSIQELLAEFFEIDLNKIETEKRAMLESIRSAS